jgi:hypothetical protein
MKEYVPPEIQVIDLRSEENIATPIPGCYTNPSGKKYEEPSGSS